VDDFDCALRDLPVAMCHSNRNSRWPAGVIRYFGLFERFQNLRSKNHADLQLNVTGDLINRIHIDGDNTTSDCVLVDKGSLKEADGV